MGLTTLAQLRGTARATSVGQAYDALPGLLRVPVAEPSGARVSAALSMGYGVTEALAGESGSHQRISSIVAIGVAPLPRLQFGLSAAGRYDRHPSDAQGSDSGLVIEPRISARWVEPLGPLFTLGLELGAWFPGTEDASRTLRATSPHAALLSAFARGPLTVAARGGYRIDRSTEAVPDLDRLRQGDRIALGLSDFDAALAGLGVGYRIGGLLLLGEASAELLLGGDAPPLQQSPIGAAAGARYAVDEVWTLELLAEASFSGRPGVAAGETMVPVQPRYAVLAGVRFRLLGAGDAPTPAPERAPAPAPAPARVDLQLEVSYSMPGETAIARATLQQNGAELDAARIGPHELRFAGATPGQARLVVVADGYEPSVQQIEISPGRPQRVRVDLKALPLRAQIRGLVRSLAGQSLPARVRVEPLGVEATTDAAGFFEIDVPAGRYEVRIQAQGYRAQQKSVLVEEDGVIILNADLLKEP